MTPYSGQTASEQRWLVAVSIVSVLVGGVCGWAAAFSGFKLWGLALGAVITVSMLVVVARRGVAHGRLGALLAFGFAFVLLTWPLLWLVVGYIRYLITGQTLGTSLCCRRPPVRWSFAGETPSRPDRDALLGRRGRPLNDGALGSFRPQSAGSTDRKRGGVGCAASTRVVAPAWPGRADT